MAEIHFAKTTVKKRRKINCIARGCTKSFLGYLNAKYCIYHKNPKNRFQDPNKKKVKKIEKNFFEFPIDFEETTIIERKCDLRGCEKLYRLTIYPTQKIYPKFCSLHLNQYQRELYLRLNFSQEKENG